MRKVGTMLFTCAIFLLNVLAYLNGIVFQLYKFHINGFVLDLAFGEGGNQVFVFNDTLVLHGVFIGLLILLCPVCYFETGENRDLSVSVFLYRTPVNPCLCSGS